MSEGALQFWFEFGSTYSYVSVWRIGGLADAAGVSVKWKPFLLGPVFQQWGWNDSPFNLFPAKGRYMWRDLERLCKKEGIPFRKPSEFPRQGLLAARLALIASDEGFCPEFTRAVFMANLASDRDISEPETIGPILESLGRDPQALLERAEAPDTKERLRAQTEEAIRLGIFGAPSFVVGGELFWGNDRLEDALSWCQQAAK